LVVYTIRAEPSGPYSGTYFSPPCTHAYPNLYPSKITHFPLKVYPPSIWRTVLGNFPPHYFLPILAQSLCAFILADLPAITLAGKFWVIFCLSISYRFYFKALFDKNSFSDRDLLSSLIRHKQPNPNL
jgi:hypothetical protein